MQGKHLNKFVNNSCILTLLTIIFVGCGSSSSSNGEGETNTTIGDATVEVFENKPEPIIKDGYTYKKVISPITQRVWLDKNLGATQACTALDDEECYGDYYQWGRDSDGHEKLNTTSETLATDVSNVGHSDFIINPIVDETKTNDWATSSFSDGSIRSMNWSKTDGSSICPLGFRVPTIEEIDLEVASIKNNTEAFESFLKLPSAGFAPANTGKPYFTGGYGTIWSSTADGDKSKHFGFYDTDVQKNNTSFRGGGFSVRCIED